MGNGRPFLNNQVQINDKDSLDFWRKYINGITYQSVEINGKTAGLNYMQQTSDSDYVFIPSQISIYVTNANTVLTLPTFQFGYVDDAGNYTPMTPELSLMPNMDTTGRIITISTRYDKDVDWTFKTSPLGRYSPVIKIVKKATGNTYRLKVFVFGHWFKHSAIL